MQCSRILTTLLAAAALTLPCVSAGQTGVTATLPNGREIHPAGNWIPLAPYPFALSVRPDGAQVAAPSIGFPFALNVIDAPNDPHPSVRRMPSGDNNDPAIEVHAGLAYSPDGSTLYVATGDSGKIRAYSTADWKPVGELSLDGVLEGKTVGASFAATLVVSADGNTLYVLDQGNWRVVLVDAHRLSLIASIPTGAYPFGLALSPDGKRMYVTNTGLFEYKTIPGADRDHMLESGLHFPAFGFPSKAAREGATVEGKQIPGLGDENSDRAVRSGRMTSAMPRMRRLPRGCASATVSRKRSKARWAAPRPRESPQTPTQSMCRWRTKTRSSKSPRMAHRCWRKPRSHRLRMCASAMQQDGLCAA